MKISIEKNMKVNIFRIQQCLKEIFKYMYNDIHYFKTVYSIKINISNGSYDVQFKMI